MLNVFLSVDLVVDVVMHFLALRNGLTCSWWFCFGPKKTMLLCKQNMWYKKEGSKTQASHEAFYFCKAGRMTKVSLFGKLTKSPFSFPGARRVDAATGLGTAETSLPEHAAAARLCICRRSQGWKMSPKKKASLSQKSTSMWWQKDVLSHPHSAYGIREISWSGSRKTSGLLQKKPLETCFEKFWEDSSCPLTLTHPDQSEGIASFQVNCSRDLVKRNRNISCVESLFQFDGVNETSTSETLSVREESHSETCTLETFDCQECRVTRNGVFFPDARVAGKTVHVHLLSCPDLSEGIGFFPDARDGGEDSSCPLTLTHPDVSEGIASFQVNCSRDLPNRNRSVSCVESLFQFDGVNETSKSETFSFREESHWETCTLETFDCQECSVV